MSPKKTVNAGGKRGGNPGHTICPLWGVIFWRVFEAKIFKTPKFDVNIVRGWFGETENSEPKKKTGKHYKNRGLRTVLRSEWAKRAKLKLDNKKRKFVQTKAPRK